jgi:hypothetical protein
MLGVLLAGAYFTHPWSQDLLITSLFRVLPPKLLENYSNLLPPIDFCIGGHEQGYAHVKINRAYLLYASDLTDRDQPVRSITAHVFLPTLEPWLFVSRNQVRWPADLDQSKSLEEQLPAARSLVRISKVPKGQSSEMLDYYKIYKDKKMYATGRKIGSLSEYKIDSQKQATVLDIAYYWSEQGESGLWIECVEPRLYCQVRGDSSVGLRLSFSLHRSELYNYQEQFYRIEDQLKKSLVSLGENRAETCGFLI